MRTQVRWTEKTLETEGVRAPVYDLCYSPSGDQVVVACGTRVAVYSAANGTVIHSLKGHKDTVYCVSYSADGKRFASGGADKTVIIWTQKGEGILKYAHNDSIQAIQYNPVTAQLASVTQSDYGLWSPDQKSVAKHKIPSKGLCCSWTSDGQVLAIGMLNGHVSLRYKGMEEKFVIKRTAPVWTLAFNPVREDGIDVLAVGSWDQRLSFYSAQGKQIGKDKELTCDPCCISYFSSGDYLLVAGGGPPSDHQAALHNKEGTFLVKVAECLDWVWAVRQRPKQFNITVGTNDGLIQGVEVSVTTVHSIYQDQYVYRDNMTEVVIQHLSTDKKSRVNCKDYVKKVAIYKDRLAVQLSDRIIIYELLADDQHELKVKEKERIRKKLECSLLCVTASNLILCQDRRLTSYDFTGNKRREWSMESVIRYIKVVGGLADREALLVGLKNGQIVKIFVDNSFPTQLVKLNVPVRCLDLSASRNKLAVVDENNLLQVYNLNSPNKELLFQENNATAVSWNSDYEDMLCFTGNNTLSIKTGNLPAFQQKLQGLVVGFKANKVFTLHFSTMSAIDVPHSHALYRYVERRDFEAAYRVACLGVTDGDWKMLGTHAMTHLQLEIARKAFIRIREVKFVELLNRIELERRQARGPSAGDDSLLLGDILAFQGKYHEAAKHFVKSGQEPKAIEMFCDMKMWLEAKQVCSNEEHIKELIRRQARWAEESQDYSEAAQFYLAAGDFARAIRMMGEAGAIDKLVDVCRTLPKSDTALIAECGTYFRKHNALQYALEAYEKIGDARALLQIHVEMNMWKEAFRLLDRFPMFAAEVYVPWAGWLAQNDRFEEAQEAFKIAKRPREARHMMEMLAANSVVCRKFNDAAFYFYKLALECGQMAEGEAAPSQEEIGRRIKRHREYVRRAIMYYAYHTVYKYVSQPCPFEPVSVFNTAKCLLALTQDSEDIPLGIAKVDVLFTLARLSSALDMNRTARTIYEKLQQVVLPVPIMEQLDVETLVCRGRPFQDKDELLDMCYRCGQTVPVLTTGGDRCPSCNHPFMRSMRSFDSLPLVEFVIANDLSDETAENLLLHGIGKKAGPNDNLSGKKAGGADVMTLENGHLDAIVEAQMVIGDDLPQSAGGNSRDPFYAQLSNIMRPGRPKGEYLPFMANLDILRQFRSDEVFIVKQGNGNLPIQNKYYRVMVAGVGITLCPGCQLFFHDEEYELEYMKGNGCAVCRYKKEAKLTATEEMMLGN
ncbi:WD40 repeat-containing protein, putative [Bodo saltans]|uniref:Intraflagellar transport protein 122 homolog n=1 Tax=Bodo saltans TaxID=75058 RepID=A0A0S4J7A2_BODSA|nr:WD40 repeat-containing protein, putative [Bodo saltans]|eukprot:CUG87361.1 WD40 repeat-containing protein, putative [Bodo saltans]